MFFYPSYLERAAVVDCDGKRVTTYRELLLLASDAARKLKSAGVKRGGAVIVQTGRTRDFLAAELGAFLVGAAAIPALESYPEKRVAMIAENAGGAFLARGGFFPLRAADEAFPAEEIAEDDELFLVYTSGSTGKPKGVVYTLKSFVAAYERSNVHVRDISPLRFGASAPFTFIASVVECYTTLSLGGCVHLLSDETRTDLGRLETYYAEHGITIGFLSPKVLKLFQKKGDSLKRVLTGSERLSDTYKENFEVYNCYSQSEAFGVCSFLVDRPYPNTPVGKPLPGAEILLLGENGKPVPDGEEGEICLRGVFAAGYKNMPEETGRVFVKDGDKTIVHTGDIGKKLPSGDLLFVNRKDWMVKINGQRVEPGEIESALAAIPEISQAVVKHFSPDSGAYLAAYYVSEKELSKRFLRETLMKSLPAYMIPSYFVRLDKMPVNINGKTDRTALEPPVQDKGRAAYEEPKSDAERTLAAAFERVLGCGVVGAEDDFFELGGDSIKAMQLQSVCGLPSLTASAVFRGRTPRGIAALLSPEAADPYEAAKAAESDVSPLTAEQLGVYVACVKTPDGVMYNNPISYELPASVDEELLEQALCAVVKAHPALNLRIETRDGVPCMIKSPSDFRMERIEAKEEEAEAAKRAFVRPFDLSQAGFYRFALLQTQQTRYLLADFHHLIFDGTSLGVIGREIARAYRGLPLEEERYSIFLSHAVEEQTESTEEYRKARDFFARSLENTEASAEFTEDCEAAERSDCPAEEIIRPLAIRVADAEAFAQQCGVTPASCFIAAYEYSLAKFLGQTEILAYTVHHGRSAAVAGSVGMFVKTLPLYVKLDETVRVADFVKNSDAALRETIANSAYPFHKLAEEYGLSAEFLFAYQSDSFNTLSLAGETIPARNLPVKNALSKLNLMLFKEGESYSLRCCYRCDLYRKETVSSFLRLFETVVGQFFKAETLQEIELCGEEDLRLLDGFQMTSAEPPAETSVVDLLRAQAKKTPEKRALVFGEKSYTYSMLDDLSDRLAARLAALGVKRGEIVSVLIGRNEYMAIASIGVLKAGAAYQPLDPSYPEERLEFMIADANARILITERPLRQLVGRFAGETLYTDEIPALPTAALPAPPLPDDPFILLYTSGSTGTPKGCILDHGNLVDFISWYKRFYALDETSRVAAYASYGFDACMMDLYPALTSGAEVHILDEAIRLDLIAIGNYFNENGITNAFMTTQVGRAFAASVKAETLKTLSVGGEQLVPLPPPAGYTLYNGYGPTECTVFSTIQKVDALYHRVPIGKPVSDFKVYVLDAQGRRLPVGAAGELYLAGRQVSRGYLNRPEKTEEVFLPNPFTQEKPYDRMYRTGDIVRLLPNGALDFAGRRDGQVKIRGFRVELPEVEGVIRRFEGVKDAAVIAIDTANGGKELAAFLCGPSPIDTDALKAFIGAEKPPYMIPSVITQIPQIPLNVNGKVDRRKLLQFKPETKKAEKERPMSYFEKMVAEIVGKILGAEAPSVTENLLLSGFNSISVLRLAVEINKVFGYECDVRQMMKGASIFSLSDEIEKYLLENRSGEKKQEERVRRSVPLSTSQFGVYADSMKRPGSTFYNIPLIYAFPKSFDAGRLKDSVAEVLRAHPYLGTGIGVQGDEILQSFSAELVPEITLLSMTDAEAETYTDCFVQPFALSRPPLYRVAVLDAESAVWLLADFHHIVFDGASANLFLNQLKTVYEGGKIPPEEYTYFDYAAAEETKKNSEEYARAETFFGEMLKDCESASELSPDAAREQAAESFAEEFLPFDAEKAAAGAAKEGVTPAAFWLAAAGYALSRFVNSRSVYLNTISNGRSDLRTANCFGMFVRTLPVAVSVEKTDVLSFLKKTGETLRLVIENEIYPYSAICEKYSYAPTIVYEYQLDVIDELVVDGKPIRQKILPPSETKFKLAVHIEKKNGAAGVTVQYAPSLYSKALMQTLARSICNVGARMSEDLTAPVRKISLLDAGQKEQLAAFSISREGEIPVKTLHGLFEAQAEKTPERRAIIARDGKFTYRETDERANAVANRLLSLGSRSGTKRVAVLLPRTAKAIICMLGIMKAGSAFIPVNPEYPEERIRLILEDSDADYIIAEKELASRYPNGLDADVLLAEKNTEKPPVHVDPDDLAYLIYTSGSTGRPKGVMLRHLGIANYLTDVEENPQIHLVVQNCSVYGALTTFAFDMSLKETMASLTHGLTLAIADDEQVVNPVSLTEFFRENRVDVCNGTPSRILQYTEYEPFLACLKNCKVILSGGEKYPDTLLRLLKNNTKAHILNTYGPTEITVSSNAKELTNANAISVGKPLYNYREYIVDADDNLLPVGVVGELLIGGVGVGKGYNHLEEQTKKAFVEFCGERVYRSGDYAKWTQEGDVVILGRTDTQVKIRGLRIEPGEIESALAAIPGIRQSAVLIKKIGAAEALCAYYTAEKEFGQKELKEALSEKLAEYMVPQYFVFLKEMPLTPNGKVNVRALPMPESDRRDGTLPRTETEKLFCKIFAEILKTDDVYADDNFFEIGGSSLTATRIIIEADKRGIGLAYGDVFKYPTPQKLAAFVGDGKIKSEFEDLGNFDYSKIDALLANNTLENFLAGEKRPIGNLLLTGAGGYLGIHILKTFLENYEGKVFCLLRGKHGKSAQIRLASLYFYYFEKTLSADYPGRLEIIEGDITARADLEKLVRYPIDTVINCAANVKHFSEKTDIEDVNYYGVINLLEYCKRANCRFIQISTMSVGGIFVGEKGPVENITETQLYFGQKQMSKYTLSKFLAERAILSAGADGADVKIMRVGTLAPRESDGEYQINFLTNTFMGRLKSACLIGAYPYSQEEMPFELSPIDSVADAVLRLSETPNSCVVFHPYNNHCLLMGDLFRELNEAGLPLRPAEEEEYDRLLEIAKQDESTAKVLSSVIAYRNMAHGQRTFSVGKSNRYTMQVLFRLGFYWPATSRDYMLKFIKLLKGLGYFEKH